MRHGGGGGGMGNDESGNPVRAQVGVLTAGLTFVALFHLLRMPFVRPAMSVRVVVCAFVLMPLTLMAGDPPYAAFWWDIVVLIAAGWCSEAKETHR